MKKTYMIPTLKVVKVQPAQFIAASQPGLMDSKTEYTSGNLGRRSRFSRWEEDDFEEE